MKPCTARRNKSATQFLGFLMNCLAMMNTRQATRVELTQLLCFSYSGRILIVEKPSSNGLGIIRNYTPLKFVDMVVKLDELV